MTDSLVIIPTYNEKDNIKEIIQAVFSLEKAFDILIVDDNSPDGTSAIVKELQRENSERLFLEKRAAKTGLGTAYIHGFRWALQRNYAYIFEMDADFSHNPDDLEKLYEACHKGIADVSIGSRYVKGVNVVNWPMKRILLSYIASRYVRVITGMPIHDTTAGFVCYRKKALQSVDLNDIHFIGYAFQIEMKFKLWKQGFLIKEVPVIFTDRTRGTSKMSGTIITEAIFGIIEMKLRSLFNKKRTG